MTQLPAPARVAGRIAAIMNHDRVQAVLAHASAEETVELARELVRRFNYLYASEGKPVLVEPHPYLTESAKILGLDGRKMSKSYGNAVELGEDPEQARKRIMVAVTDPARKRRHDPGHPEVCPIYHLHRAYSSPERVEMVDRECRSAGIGCVDCKKMLLENLLPALEKHRAAREELLRQPGRVDELVRLGTEKARGIAEQTMVKVRAAMKLV
jgi:tryptophanyl-tRNA synthetase